MGKMKALLIELQEQSFNDYLSDAEEQLLDMLEQEWLEQQHAAYLEDFDYWQVMAAPKKKVH